MLPRPDAYRQCKRLNLSQLALTGAILQANGADYSVVAD